MLKRVLKTKLNFSFQCCIYGNNLNTICRHIHRHVLLKFVMVIDTGSGISMQTSNSGQDNYIHFQTNSLGKIMNLFFSSPSYGLNNRID